ncbi:MAG TPA: O-antigen ligase family protein [Gemmatimonadales bacterium]|nr:O-antigen ligase family protein [Gemmatimonadales bacterium]
MRRGHQGLWIVILICWAGASAAWPRVAGLGGVALVCAVAWRYPLAVMHLASFAALAIRPALDWLSERRLGLGPFTMSPAVIFGGLILITGAVLALRRGHDGRRLWPDRPLATAHVWLAIAYAIMAVSGWRLYDGEGLAEAVREVLRMASVVAAFFIMYWWLDEDASARRRAWWYLALGAVLPIAVSLEQLVTGTGFIEPDGTLRIQGTFSHPNSFGQYLIPFVCVLVAGRGHRPARLSLAVALSIVVALTYSRTAILALAAALVILLLLESGLDVRRLVRVVVAVTMVAGLAWFLVGGIITRRFSGIAFNSAAWQDALAGQSENSFQWRIINWSGLVLLGLNHPWLGHGAGMTTVLNPLTNSDNGVPFNAHDDYVRLFFEGGVVSLVCYVLYQILLILWVIRRSRAASEPERGSSLALGASLCGMTVLTAGTTELSLQTANLYVLYGLLAIASAGRSLPTGSTSARRDAAS